MGEGNGEYGESGQGGKYSRAAPPGDLDVHKSHPGPEPAACGPARAGRPRAAATLDPRLSVGSQQERENRLQTSSPC